MTDNKQMSGTRKIPLTKGKHALVDTEDYDELNKQKWHCAARAGGKFYAKTWNKVSKRPYYIMMHRLIIKCPPDMDIDHINNNGLDNRKENLRICTRSQNLANKGKGANNKSGYKGVHWDKRAKKWYAGICFNRKRIFIGYFHNVLNAADAYDEVAIKYHGKFAKTNKNIKDGE